MSKIIKNTTLSDIELDVIGLTIPQSSQYTIEETEYLLWASLDSIAEISPYITSGDIVVNDSIQDLPVSQAIDYLKYPHTALSQRFLSEPERSNSMSSKTTQEAIEEARPDIQKDGVSILDDVDIIDFTGGSVNVTSVPAERKVIVEVNDFFYDTLYCVDAYVCGNEIKTSSFTPLVDDGLSFIKSEDC